MSPDNAAENENENENENGYGYEYEYEYENENRNQSETRTTKGQRISPQRRVRRRPDDRCGSVWLCLEPH